MWARRSTAIALLLLLTGQANSQSTQEVIGPIPKPIVVQTSPVAPGVFEQTPTFAARRRQLNEPLSGGPTRTLLQTDQLAIFGPTIALGSAIIAQIGSLTLGVSASVNITVGRRKLLSTLPELSFIGEVKKDTWSGAAVASYLFDASTAPFFAGFMQSGQDAQSAFQFLRALLILPEDGVWGTTAPPYAVSEHGFISPDGKPVIVRLKTKRQTDHAPALGLRFDYAQQGVDAAGAPCTPYVSVYFTDFVDQYPWGLPGSYTADDGAQINLAQSFNFAPLPNKDGEWSEMDDMSDHY